jgi:hypothetical protein
VKVHPLYKQMCAKTGSTSTNFYTKEMQRYDVGVFHLKQPIKDIPVAQFSSKAPQVNDRVTFVGFGLSSANTGLGVKRKGTAIIRTVDDHIFWANPSKLFFSFAKAATMGGDSGGASFDRKGRLLGVITSCGSGDWSKWSGSVRTSKHHQWIMSHMANNNLPGGGGSGEGGFGEGQPYCTASLCNTLSKVPGSSPSCYCDSACTSKGDCCPGYAAVCNW